MSTQSKIEWTERTWNPTVDCTKISQGCKHCYAETMALRLNAMCVRGYEDGFQLTLMPELRMPNMGDKAHVESGASCIWLAIYPILYFTNSRLYVN